jgi:hypothetical protein
MNDAVRYFKQDISRDPTELRSKWIIAQLIRRPHFASELYKLSETNGLGYRPSTYSRDLTGLIKRNLISDSGRIGGVYSITQYGLAWAEARGLEI